MFLLVLGTQLGDFIPSPPVSWLGIVSEKNLFLILIPTVPDFCYIFSGGDLNMAGKVSNLKITRRVHVIANLDEQDDEDK